MSSPRSRGREGTAAWEPGRERQSGEGDLSALAPQELLQSLVGSQLGLITLALFLVPECSDGGGGYEPVPMSATVM